MGSLITPAALLLALGIAIFTGYRLRHLLPEHHLSPESRDTIKLAMGLVATMTALLLGLLVTSAKGTYDSQRTVVIELGAKVALMNRVLLLYGPDAADVRSTFKEAMHHGMSDLWPSDPRVAAKLVPDPSIGNRFHIALEALTPADEAHRSLKAYAITLATEIAQHRMLLTAHAAPSIPPPLLLAVCSWLVIIFAYFSLLARPNPTSTSALLAAALSVALAVFLIGELDRPLGGLLRVPNTPMLRAVEELSK